MLQKWIWQDFKWPAFEWDAGALLGPLSHARQQQGRLLGRMDALESKAFKEAASQILVEDGLMTNAIEGEFLDRESVRSSVARRLGLESAGLRPATRATDGLIDLLLDATHNHTQPLTLERLCGWHAALFPTGYSGIHEINVGNLRGDEPMEVVSGPIGRQRVHFRAPERHRLDAEMATFLDWFNQPPTNDGLIRAAVAHLWFITIHPFEDGNGRIARAITDMALSQDEGTNLRPYSMSAQIHLVRDAYYDALEATQRGSLDITGWIVWFLEQVVRATELSQELLARVLLKSRFWAHFAQEALSERQTKVLNQLLDAEPGGFEGGMNTRKYVSLTKTSRATAFRELNDLVQRGCLRSIGQGRSTSYEVVFDFEH